jgi:hypothetical protein
LHSSTLWLAVHPSIPPSVAAGISAGQRHVAAELLQPIVATAATSAVTRTSITP